MRDELALRSALEIADIDPSITTLNCLADDFKLLDKVAPHIKGAWNFLETILEDLKAAIRLKLVSMTLQRRHDDFRVLIHAFEPGEFVSASNLECDVGNFQEILFGMLNGDRNAIRRT